MRQIVRAGTLVASTAGACLAVLLASPLPAQDTARAASDSAPTADVAAIRAAAAAYREALARGDTPAIRAAWTADGDIIDSLGNVVPAAKAAGAEGERPQNERPAVQAGETRLRRIRSWSFSTDGSRAEATWFRDGTSWISRGASVLPDGTQVHATNIYTFDGKDRCVWRVVQPPLVSGDGLPTRATWVRKAGDAAR